MKRFNYKKTEDQVIRYLRRRRIVNFLRTLTLPGFGGVPLTEVVKFFFKRLGSEAVALRASASAYSFFLALFPGLIVLFTLIPYVPVDHLQEEMLNIMRQIMPSSAFATIEDTLQDILTRRRGNLLSFGFVLTIYFSSNGVNTLLVAFNSTLKRPWWKKYLIAVYLTFVLFFLVLIALVIQIGGEIIIGYFKDSAFFGGGWVLAGLWLFKLLVTVMLSITAISILFFYASEKESRFKFYSPGAFVSTIFVMLVSYGFGYYVEHFGRYNKLYGSIGALIVLMIWLYLSAISLMAGYEFNQSIFRAREKFKDTFRFLKANNTEEDLDKAEE